MKPLVWKYLLLSLGFVAIVATVVIIASAQRFNSRLNAIASALKEPLSSQARTDLPAAVAELAKRLGVDASRSSHYSQFEETGQMWSEPGSSAMSFSAQQTVSTSKTGFLWRATAGPGGLIKVADYLIGATGGLEARIFGSVAVANDVGAAQTIQGEAMRYLAELPWNPDALLYNHSLEWTVVNARRLRVATGTGKSRAEVTLDLDGNGLIAGAGAEARPRLEGHTYVLHPWHGHFWNYARVQGRMIPMSGEVAWTIGATQFVYWRGQVKNWAAAL